MTLTCDNTVDRYLAQSLALLFFPGSGFPQDGSGGEPYMDIGTTKDEEGRICGRARISDGRMTVERTYTPSANTAARVSAKSLASIAAGGAVYFAGRDFCGSVPPWGILTGVRPAKLCREMLEAGVSADEAQKRLETDYLCSPEKAEMAVLCAERERAFITEKARRECSVYIAVPFCPTRCSYCSFVSFSSPRLLSLIPAYVERLCEDVKNTFKIIDELGLRVATVYIGGGTPTTLTPDQLERLLCAVGKATDISRLDEFTLEAGRPDTITAEKLRIAYGCGVSRVSVNAQTMNPDILRAVGRRHTPEEFLSAFETAKNSGIRDINVDLIAGLPGETAESFLSSVNKIISLDPTNITVHTFYVKRAAEIQRKDPGVYRTQDRETSEAVRLSHSALGAAGYSPYYLYRQKNTAANLENAGFSKIGHEGLYNIFMMDEVHTVFGAGASAMTKLVSPDVSHMKIQRICETKYPYEYLDPEKSSAGERYKRLRAAGFEFYGKKL